MVVTDPKGKRVTDLAADDFTITEDSKPHVIKHFDRIHGDRTAAPLSSEPGLYTNLSPAEAAPPSITVILLDSVNTSALDQKHAIEQIGKMLSFPFPGPVAVWQLGAKGIVVVQDFTSDQRELAAAARRLSTARSAEDLLNTTAVAAIRPFNFLSPNKDYSGTINQYADVDAEQKGNELAVHDATRQTLETMVRVARALRQVQGRKSLFWATGGLSSTVEDQIGKELAAANVSVYPIEVTAGKGPRDSPVYFNNRVRYRKTEANGLRALAEQTGGVYCPYAGQASDCLAGGVEDASDYYLLAFSIDSRHVVAGAHPIEVRVRRPDLHVRARSAYYIEDRSKQRDRGSEIASAMDSPLDLTNLPFAIRWLGRKESSGKVSLSFRLLVAKGVLQTNQQNDAALDLSFAATAFEKGGKPVGTLSKDVSGVLSPATQAQLAGNGLFWDGSIEVDSSASVVRFVVRDNITGRLGSVSASIPRHVPAPPQPVTTSGI